MKTSGNKILGAKKYIFKFGIYNTIKISLVVTCMLNGTKLKKKINFKI